MRLWREDDQSQKEKNQEQIMLYEDFHKWRKDRNNNSPFTCDDSEDNFEIFFQQYTSGKSFEEMVADFAYQIHCLQESVEGLLEDLEI